MISQQQHESEMASRHVYRHTAVHSISLISLSLSLSHTTGSLLKTLSTQGYGPSQVMKHPGESCGDGVIKHSAHLVLI